MTDRLIGSGYLSILPETGQFQAQAEAKIKSALSGVKPSVNIQANLNQSSFQKTIAQMKAELKALSGTNAMTVNGNTAPLQAKLTALAAQAAALQAALNKTGGGAGPDNLISQTAVAAALQNMGKMGSRIQTIRESLDEAGATGQDAFDAITKAVGLAEDKLSDLKVNGIISPSDVQGVTDLDKSLRTLESSMDISTGAAGKATSGYGFFGAIIHGLSNVAIPLFASSMDNVSGSVIPHVGSAIMGVLPHMLSYASGWHLAAEAIIEFTAVWIPAGIAIAAFVAAAVPEAKAVYTQLDDMNTVAKATGQTFADFPKLTGSITAALKPQLLELYGIALQGVDASSGQLGGALDVVAKGVDNVAAKIVAWMSGTSGGLEKFIKSGAEDAGLLADGFVQLGRTLATLLQSVPGYAKMLLEFGDACLTVLADVVHFIQPAIALFLKLHGAIFYIGLATTIVASFGTAFLSAMVAVATGSAVEATTGKFAALGSMLGSLVGKLAAFGAAVYGEAAALTALASEEGIAAAASKGIGDAMEAIPFGATGLAIGIAATAIGVLLYMALKRTTGATQDFINEQNKMIAASNYSNLQVDIANAIQNTSQQMQQNNTVIAKYNELQKKATSSGSNAVSSINDQSYAMIAATRAADGATEANSQLKGALSGYVDQLTTTIPRQNQLNQEFGNANGVMALFSLAGQNVTKISTDSASQFAQLIIQLKGVEEGYGLMASQSGAAGNQLDTLNISTSDAYKAVQTLTSAETGWLTLMSGGVSDLNTFESGMSTLTQAQTTLNSSWKTLNTAQSHYGTTQKTLTADQNAVTTNTLAQESAMAGQITSAGTLFGSLQSLSSALGNTTKSQGLVTTAMKGTIAQMLPFAQGSVTNTAMLSNLAQLVGGPATSNYKTLAKWVGNTTNAQADAITATNHLTTANDNLSTAAKNLATTLSGDITQAQGMAIMQNGLTTATNNFDHAMINSNDTLNQSVRVAGTDYYNALVKAGLSTNQAEQYTDAFMKQQGYTQTAINGMNQYLDQQQTKLNNVSKAAKAAQGALGSYASGSPYNAVVQTTVSATGTVQAKGAGPGLNDVLAHVSFTSSGHFARGGVVPGASAGGDNHLAMVKSGELIIPSQHAPKFANMAKAAGIPGFASGGLIGNQDASAIGAVNNADQTGNTAFGKGVMTAVAADLQNYLKSMTASAGGAGGPYNGSGNLLSIAKWFESNGATAAAAAGIASVISGESGGNPESREQGGSGWGLIQWTGNTQGLPAGYDGPTGNFNYDMGVQLRGAMGYIASRGGLGKINAAGSPIGAGDVFSAMEAPAVALSDTRPALANQLYESLMNAGGSNSKAAQTKAFSAGGVTPEGIMGLGTTTGMPYSIGTGEYVGPLMGNSANAMGLAGGNTQVLVVLLQKQNDLIAQQNKLLQGAPQAYAQALNGAVGGGVRRAYAG